MKRLLYWAYGSNILESRIRARLGHCRVIRNHTLVDYKLTWDGGPGGGYLNIRSCPNSSVEGILYHLSDPQIRELDMYEGYPRNYQKFYFTSGDDIIFGYWTRNNIIEIKPFLSYLNLVIDGCKEKGLENTYNLLVKYKNQNFNLKKGSKHK